ncbi:MAG: HlyD family efflux transporter periplasmic adaptor subunit [Gorillibacterium sp.]|nr:HlyD family efflux transporter periplasmic adaptor subunit [Gorillibacterium sp.]
MSIISEETPAAAPTREKAPIRELTSLLHSEGMQEVVGQVPSNITRWGITGLFGILITFLVFCYYIKYPDLVEAPLVLKAYEEPKLLLARIDGNLDQILVQEGQFVQRNAPLAYLQTTADGQAVKALSTWATQLTDALLQGKPYPPALRREYTILKQQELGEVQPAFQSFSQAHAQYVLLLKNGFYDQKKAILLEELQNLNKTTKVLQQQKLLRKQDLNLTEQEFAAQERLYAERVISDFDFKREKAKVLAKKVYYQQIESDFINNLNNQTAKKSEVLELNKLVQDQANAFLTSLNALKSALLYWKQNYVISSPVAGTLHFASSLQEKQPVSLRQALFYITNGQALQYGEIQMPQQDFGKIRVGHQVIVKFEGYPAQQFGSVPAKIMFVSTLPTADGTYMVKVYFPQGLKTSRNIKLYGRIGMLAKAQVITQDLRLLDRFFYQFRKLVH